MTSSRPLIGQHKHPDTHFFFFFIFFFFFGQRGVATCWRVCYQRGLPRPVYLFVLSTKKKNYGTKTHCFFLNNSSHSWINVITFNILLFINLSVKTAHSITTLMKEKATIQLMDGIN